jgi:hypothetical protein
MGGRADTSTAIGRMFFQILDAIPAFEPATPTTTTDD